MLFSATGISVQKFYGRNLVSSTPATVVAVADELFCQVEAGLRYPRRAKNSFKIKCPIHLSDRTQFDGKLLDTILKKSHWYHLQWHTRLISPHGDKNMISDPWQVRLKVQRKRRDARYVEQDGALKAVKPNRGYEVVGILTRKRE